MGILLQGWGRDISPYPLRFEPQLADGGTSVIGPDGDFPDAPEDPQAGRLLRANFPLDPLSRFYATRSFGMDAGVPRDDSHVAFDGPGELRIAAMFRYRFRAQLSSAPPGTIFVFCDADVQIYVEEFDARSQFVRAVVPAAIPVARMRSGVIEFGAGERTGGDRVLNAVVPTVPGNSYRIWADVQLALTAHGAGLVRFEVGIPFVLGSFVRLR